LEFDNHAAGLLKRNDANLQLFETGYCHNPFSTLKSSCFMIASEAEHLIKSGELIV